MISTYLYLYKLVLSDMGIHVSKEKKKPSTFKTYIFVQII